MHHSDIVKMMILIKSSKDFLYFRLIYMRKCSLVDFFTPLGHLMSLVTGQLGSPVPSAVSTALVFQCRVLKPLVFQSLPYRVQSTGLPVAPIQSAEHWSSSADCQRLWSSSPSSAERSSSHPVLPGTIKHLEVF